MRRREYSRKEGRKEGSDFGIVWAKVDRTWRVATSHCASGERHPPPGVWYRLQSHDDILEPPPSQQSVYVSGWRTHSLSLSASTEPAQTISLPTPRPQVHLMPYTTPPPPDPHSLESLVLQHSHTHTYARLLSSSWLRSYTIRVLRMTDRFPLTWNASY